MKGPELDFRTPDPRQTHLQHVTLVRERGLPVVGLGKPAPPDALSQGMAAEAGLDVNVTRQLWPV